MITFRVDKDIPLPEDSFLRQYKYPFPDMEVGDSFFVSALTAPMETIRVGVCNYQRDHPGLFFTVRKVEGGVRVWRVATKESKKVRAHKSTTL